MAKDDYFVIVYKILAYLYARLKKGEPVEAEMLMYDGGLFQINREYWVYIIDNMLGFTIRQICPIVNADA